MYRLIKSVSKSLALAGCALAASFLPAGASMDIKEITTPSGLTVWFLPDQSAPLVSVSFAFKGGSIYDPAGKEGLAFLLEGLLTEGAGDLDSQAYSAAINDIGMRLSFSSGRDYFTGRFTTLTDFQDRAAELFNATLTQPRFDQEAIARNISQVKTRLQIDAKDPQWIAIRQMRELLYADHPYARRQRGTDTSLDAITRDDLLAFVGDRFAKDTLVIGASGDISEADLGPYIDRLFADIADTASLKSFEKATLNNPGKMEVRDWPTPQTFIMASQEGLSRDHPDYLIAYVVNHILGGSTLSTRLNKELREKRGWTYGASSFFSLGDLAPLIQIAFSTQNEHAGDALALTKEIWGDIAQHGISEQELQKAKDYIIGNYALQRTSIRQTARYLQGLQIAGLDRSYPNVRSELIGAISKEDIQRVAKQWFAPERLRIVAVGQPQGLDDTLEAAKAAE